MRSRRDDVGVRYRVGVFTRCYQTRNMGHIDQKVRAHGIRDLTKLLPVQTSRIGGEASDDHFRLMLLSQTSHLVVIHFSRFNVNAVLHSVVQLAGEIH